MMQEVTIRFNTISEDQWHLEDGITRALAGKGFIFKASVGDGKIKNLKYERSLQPKNKVYKIN